MADCIVGTGATIDGQYALESKCRIYVIGDRKVIYTLRDMVTGRRFCVDYKGLRRLFAGRHAEPRKRKTFDGGDVTAWLRDGWHTAKKGTP